MTELERKDLTWAIWRTYERDGMQAALRLLHLVGLCYGEQEEEEMTLAVVDYREEEAAWR